jgi:hypothetical protein
MDNESLKHRTEAIFHDHKSFLDISKQLKSFGSYSTRGANILNCLIHSNSTLESKIQNNTDKNASYFVNNVFDQTKFEHDSNVFVLNCHFKDCDIEIGKNTILNDLILVNACLIKQFI